MNDDFLNGINRFLDALDKTLRLSDPAAISSRVMPPHDPRDAGFSVTYRLRPKSMRQRIAFAWRVFRYGEITLRLSPTDKSPR